MIKPINIYTSFLINEVIPFDTKISSLIKKKLFNNQGKFFRSLIHDFLSQIPKNLKEDEIVPYCKNIIFKENGINELATELQKYYLNELKSTYFNRLKKLPQHKKDKINKSLDDNDYVEAIKTVEKFLHIKTLIPKPNTKIQQHSNHRIYHKERDAIIEVIKEAKVALTFFDDYYKNKYIRPKNDDDILESIDYLALSINHELWNFLTHLSYAYYVFATPSIFISNINKSVAHLNRAILDIYDGLIMETCAKEKINPEYLNLRILKLESLGDSKKIILLSEELKKHYVDNCKDKF